MEILMLIAVLSAGVLWLSHHLHTAYVHAVAREERRGRTREHIGPRCFLALDALLLIGLLVSLDVLAFGDSGRHPLVIIAIGLTRFSALVAFWLLVERGHLESFYGLLARLRGRTAWSGENDGGGQAGLMQALLFALAFVPLALEFGGLDLAAADLKAAALLFVAFFVLPQLGLLALALRRLLPLRRALQQEA